MTAVAFHVNAPDRIAYACRLLRKAVGAGNRVLVTGEPQQLADIDQALWTFSALDFVPHCRADAPAEVLDRSPVVIAVPGRQVGKGASVRVHLGGPTDAATLDGWDRVIEVVGQGEQERMDARARWKAYANMGHVLSHHDVTAQGQHHG